MTNIDNVLENYIVYSNPYDDTILSHFNDGEVYVWTYSDIPTLAEIVAKAREHASEQVLEPTGVDYLRAKADDAVNEEDRQRFHEQITAAIDAKVAESDFSNAPLPNFFPGQYELDVREALELLVLDICAGHTIHKTDAEKLTAIERVISEEREKRVSEYSEPDADEREAAEAAFWREQEAGRTHRDRGGYYHRGFIDGFLASRTPDAHLAAAKAEALEEAASEVASALMNEYGSGHTSTYSVRQWLNARAARLREQGGE